MTQWIVVKVPESIKSIDVDGIPVILARSDSGWAAYLDDCPDESLPLEPELTRAGGIVCSQHGASFCVTSGCLLRVGKARHADRCASGLFKVEVRSSEEGVVELLVSQGLRERWAEVQQRRFRKSFGRGPIAAVRYTAALLSGASKKDGRAR